MDAPEGKLKLIISTWDNSFAPQEVTVDLAADGLIEDQDFTLAARGLATVNGSVMDASGNPVHAEIIFVDADDEERYIWPKEFIMEEDEGVFSGNFTAKIPAGPTRSLQNAGTADFYQPTTWKGPLLGHPSSTTPPP